MRSLRSTLRVLKKPMAVYVVAFLTLLGLISFFSLGNLIMAYKNDEEINNQTNSEDKLEGDFIANAVGKDFFLNLNGGMHRLLGQSQMNDVVRLKNGYLSWTNGMTDPSIFKMNAESLAEIQKKLGDRGIPFLYVMAPYKIQADDPELPHDIQDHTNEVVDSFKEELQAVGVQPLDLRESFSAQTDPYALFYRTDHHWNDRGGFLGYTVIAEQISRMLDVSVDPDLLSLDSYTEEVYQDLHLGSHGKRTGSVFAGGADDFAILVPNFDTVIVDEDNNTQGKLEDVIFDKSYLQVRDPWSLNIYDLVYRLGHFQSQTTGCGKKVLFICDSMGRAVLPYLTLAFGDVCFVDAYHPENLTQELLDSYQPDIVVMMHYPTLMYILSEFQYPNL